MRATALHEIFANHLSVAADLQPRTMIEALTMV